MIFQEKDRLPYLHLGVLWSQPPVPSESDLVCELGPVKRTDILCRSLSPGLCERAELSLLGRGRRKLLTLTNAVHPTPMMKVCLRFLKSGIGIDVDVDVDELSGLFGSR